MLARIIAYAKVYVVGAHNRVIQRSVVFFAVSNEAH